MGKATLVIQDGKIIPQNLKKLRLSADQLEAKLRVKGISFLPTLRPLPSK
ncbi:YetF domain-containing protein [Paenibacillus sp. JTLBN-2024]